ncbi:uncharacterized protein CTRU02_203708 [Colletotrichum truncatum]|uniref:Uncharacterized protein n=1 Tax=Colletotrichum truncatum TaxID=5467 RepID=A0ACC3ZA09_COLTU
MMFCRFVLFLLCKLFRMASQILLTLDLEDRSAEASAGSGADLLVRFVSLYIL